MECSAKRTLEDEALEENDWRYKYRSAFTYAAYNDLDKMGYQAPKRFRTQIGPRYMRYLYTASDAEARTTEPLEPRPAAVENIIIGLSLLLFLMTLPFSLLLSIKFVGEFERLVVLRLGRAQKTRGPGATVVLPCIDAYKTVDLRVNAFNIPPLQVITIDQGLVELGAVVFLQVKDALAAVCAVEEQNKSIRTLASAVLHRLVCKRCVSDVASSTGRKHLCDKLQVELNVITSSWGIEITKVELSEVKVIKNGENLALATFNKVLKSQLDYSFNEALKKGAQEFMFQKPNQQQKHHSQKCRKDHIDLWEDESHEKGKLRSVLNDSLEDLDIDRLLRSLSTVMDRHLVAAVGHIFQVRCAGFGDFYVDLKNGSGNCCKGTNLAADVTLCLNREMLIGIMRKKITPVQAYLDGSLRILGSIKGAMKITLLSDRLTCLL